MGRMEWMEWMGWEFNLVWYGIYASHGPHSEEVCEDGPSGWHAKWKGRNTVWPIIPNRSFDIIFYEHDILCIYIYIMYNSMCIYKHLCMFQRRLICIYLHAYPDTLHINVCMYTCIHGHGTHPKLTFLPWSAWLGKTYLSAMIYIIYTYCVNMFVSYIQCIYIYYML
jgi:hypothetical protein